MSWKMTPVVAALVIGAAASADAAVLPYRIDPVAQTGPTYASLGLPALNDAGTSAFQATSAAAGNARGVYYGNPALVQQVATPGLNVTPNAVDINNVGQIVFTALPPTNPNNLQGIDGVYRSDPTGITTIAPPWSAISQINGGPVVNNSGLVAYSVFDTAVSNLYVGNGTTSPPPPRTGTFGEIVLLGLNNAGKPLARESNSFATGNLFYDNANIVTLTSPQYTDPDFGIPGTFSVRTADVGDNDRVVFAARWNGLTDAFYLWNNGTISKVGGTNGLTGTPAINDVGTVAGLVTGATGPARLSIFSGGTEGTIISVGDALLGSTVTGLGFSPEGLNNLDQIAFQATLADGRTVNALATVPEPTGAAALVLAGAGLLGRRRRMRRTN